jgi:hypothetical protein
MLNNTSVALSVTVIMLTVWHKILNSYAIQQDEQIIAGVRASYEYCDFINQVTEDFRGIAKE